MTLSQLTADQPFIADGGLETVLIYLDGIDLPDFASFPLLDTDHGATPLAAYYTTYVQLAARLDRGVVLDTPTWRASLDWGARLGLRRRPTREHQPPRRCARARRRPRPPRVRRRRQRRHRPARRRLCRRVRHVGRRGDPVPRAPGPCVRRRRRRPDDRRSR